MAISEIERPLTDSTPEHRKQILWEEFWTALAERVGSTSRAMIAKSIFEAIQDEFGDLEAICWPSTLIERSAEHTRSEIFRALDDLVDVDLITLDANAFGAYVDECVRLPEEAEWLAVRQ